MAKCMMAVIFVVALAMSLISMSACSRATAPQDCMAGLTRALTEGEFSGPILCADTNASFVLVGRTSGDEYAIYDYRYRYRPLHAAVDHGGQRILVFHNGAYLGQYVASPPPYESVSVRGAEVRFAPSADSAGSTLDFSQGPPPEALIGGHEATFFR